jgi:sugar phosphate isomerase/epimerase
VVQAVRDIGWAGWVNLETDVRPGSLEADLRRNLGYLRRVVEQTYA